MATSIYLVSTKQIPANPIVGTPASQLVKYLATSDNTNFYYGYASFPAGDDAQTDLNANADSLLADAQAKGQLLPAQLVNCLATGATKVATLPGTTINPYLPQKLQILLAQGFHITTGPTLSIGTNSPNYNDLLAATSLATWTAQNRLLNIDLANVVGVGVAYAANTDVFVNVTIAAIVTANGLCGVTVSVIGANALNF